MRPAQAKSVIGVGARNNRWPHQSRHREDCKLYGELLEASSATRARSVPIARSGVPISSLRSRPGEILIEYYYCRIANTVLGTTLSRSHEGLPRGLRWAQVQTEWCFEKSGSAFTVQ